MLRITFFGLTLSSSWGNGHATPYRAILRALRRRGVRLTFFEKDAPYYAKYRDFTACDYCDLVLYVDWSEVRPQALARARDSDVVVIGSYCPDGARIAEDLLHHSGRSLLAFYDMDTPITLRGLEDGRVNYLQPEQIREFDLYLSFTGGSILQTLERDFGARCVRPLYGCVDPSVHRRMLSTRKYDCALSYMGTHCPDRAEKVNNLVLQPAQLRRGLSFLVVGSMYPSHSHWPANVRRIEHVRPAEHAALYSSSRVTVNLTRGEMARAGYCPSGRLFEAAACATPILTDWWEGLDTFFDVERDLAIVHTASDVLRFLDLAEGDLRAMAERARRRVLEQHTGDHRAGQLLAFCEEAASAKAVALEAS